MFLFLDRYDLTGVWQSNPSCSERASSQVPHEVQRGDLSYSMITNITANIYDHGLVNYILQLSNPIPVFIKRHFLVANGADETEKLPKMSFHDSN